MLTLAAACPGGGGGAQAKALYGAGDLATFQGDVSRAAPLLEQSLSLARAVGDEALSVEVLKCLGIRAHVQGDLERATAWYEESLALARRLGDPDLIKGPLFNLGLVASVQGDLEQADAHFAAVVAMNRQTGDLLSLSSDLTEWSAIWRRRGDLPQTFQLLREAFTILRDALARGWPMLLFFVPLQVMHLAEALAVAGRSERAARFQGAWEALREPHGYVWSAWEQTDNEAAIASARAALGEAVWAAAYAAGKALTLEEAIAEALEALAPD
jgi:tetratricopeptide (TPR) repeat protein